MAEHLSVRRLERKLHLSTLEGMVNGAMQGAGEQFTSAYAIALGATNGQLAILVSLPRLTAAVAQGTAARLGRVMGHRKRWAVAFALGQDLMWLPILFAGFHVLGERYAVYWLIASLMAYTAFSAVAAVVWGSIMSEVVPSRIRGRYFGGRSRWSTVANMLAFLGAGLLLFLLRDEGMLGFSVVFGLAFLFRAVSAGLLTTLPEAPHASQSEGSLGLGTFLRQLPTTSLGRMLLYLYCLSFGVNVASPYFTPYLLRELGLSYLTFTILEIGTIGATILSVTHWGAVADKAGNQKVLRICGVLIGLVPLLWVVSPNVVWLGFVHFYSGVVWAGFNLVSVNYIYDATPPQQRMAYLGYYNAGAGLAVALGALTGGVLIRYMPPFLGSPILGMFILSGTLRLLAGAVFLPGIKEVRKVRTVKAAELFHILLGGNSVHQPSHHGRTPRGFHLHGHRDEQV
ncbi:MAG: MFS transporter [Chloroflexi bacterium]|nr:MFS transporter [Chloroflexota bacterium]